MASIRTKNRFGRRYISLHDLRNYAVDLGISSHPPAEGFLEFLEREGLLTPVRRIRFPDEIQRRFAKDRDDGMDIDGRIEPDGPRLSAAIELKEGLHRWADSRFHGESEHVLDTLSDTHASFVQTDFSRAEFTPWQDMRIRLYNSDQGPVYSSITQDTPVFYHYWQIFWLAAILRSGVHIWFPLDDAELYGEILRGGLFSCHSLQGRSRQSINLEAYHDLKALRA